MIWPTTGSFGIKKEEKKCEEGAVCAYEYRGNLYRSKEEVKEVKRREREVQIMRKLARLFSEHADVYRNSGLYGYGERPVNLSPKRSAEVVVNNFDKIIKMMEVVK